MHNKKVLITGGSGFIGTNLVSLFLNAGWQVINFDISAPRNHDQTDYWQPINLLDQEQVINNVKSSQPVVVLHFGARTDLNEKADIQGYRTNYEGTKNLIDAISVTPSVKRIIFASSQLVCRLGYYPQHEEDYCPTTLYGHSKVLMEKVIRSSDLRVPWTIVRPTSLWGPWFDIPYKTFFLTIAKNHYVHPGRIETRKQWGFVGNSVHQIEKLVEAPVDQVDKKIFYLADYDPVYLRDFANKVQLALNAKPIRTVPTFTLQFIALIGDILHKFGWQNPPLTSFRFNNIVTTEVQDLERLKKIVGELPYSIEQGIELTTHWLRLHSLLGQQR